MAIAEIEACSGGGSALDSKCIPVMTAQSTPSGNATASSYASNYPPYKAFSADATGWYVTSAAFLNNWVKYEFDTAMVAHIFLGMAIANGALKFSIYGSNDDFASENDLLASDVVVDTTTFYKPTFLNNSKAYKYYKFLVTESNASSSCNGLKLQLIGA